MFAALSTQVLPQLLSPLAIRPMSANAKLQIEELAKDIQHYANDHQVATETSQYPFSQQHRRMVIEGLSFTVLMNGCTPFVTLGSEIPQTVFRDPNCRSFFLGASKSAHLATTTYNSFGSWENGLSGIDRAITTQMAAKHHVPFVNLFAWPSVDKTTLNAGMQFTQRYLEISKPLVLLTYGHLVRIFCLLSRLSPVPDC